MRSVAFLLFPGFQMMSLAAVTAFELANAASGDAAYTVNFLSETGGPVASSIGAAVETQPFGEAHHDTVAVVGELSAGLAPAGFIAGVQTASRRTRRIAGICTGAFPLAQAGLLDGRRATTHWAYARALQRLYPAVKVEEDRIFIADGPVWTSAGMTAAIDLALALIEEDLGRDMSRALARKLVVYHRRSGGQSQFSALLELEPKSDRIQSALTYARRNLRNPLSVEELAEAAHLSPRQFSRVFRAETGQSPAKAVENLRLEAARAMMEDGRHAIDVVARETGFADRERMRRAFLRAFGQPPQVIRRSARAEEIRAA